MPVVNRFSRSRLAVAIVGGTLLASQFATAMSPAQAQSSPSGNCQLTRVAFCDTFDAPSPNGPGTRSGDLDGVVWGVSRATSHDNPSQGQLYHWFPSHLNRCGTTVVVAAPRDVQICNGLLVESANDGEGQTVLAGYPRQPFDFAGRTGTIAFDVGNDTQGVHMAWPEIVISDQPVPAPHNTASGLSDLARNSFGFSMAAACQGGTQIPSGGDGWTVSEMFTTSNYNANTSNFNSIACVKKPTAFGQMNHVELRISPSHVEVWATDAGATTLKQIATADIAMPLTRGLVWWEDVHYNANKTPGTQADHTFAWDNFGFDGPVLPRDLGFDVLDATHDGTSEGNIGYLVPSGGALNLQIQNVRALSSASAALLEFTWWPHEQDSITFSMNGNPAHTTTWQAAGQPATYQSATLAIQVPIAELVNGTNSLTLTSSDGSLGGVSVANLDLILAGAGGQSGGGGGPTSTPTATLVPATATSVPATATSVPATATSVPATATASPKPSLTPTSTPTQVSAQRGFTISAGALPHTTFNRGTQAGLTASVRSNTTVAALVDMEIYDAAGNKVAQKWWDNQSFGAATTRTFPYTWAISPTATTGTYTVVIGVFSPGWGILYGWNGSAMTLTVV